MRRASRFAAFNLMAAGLAAGLSPAPAAAQTTTEPAIQPETVNGWPRPGAGCDRAENRQLDFWLGTWTVTWDLPGGGVGQGRNTITRTHAGCVVTESFDGGPSTNGFQGTSHSLHHARTGMWRQTWVDNQGGYFDLTGGPTNDGRFILTNIRLTDQAPHLRMVWENITPDRLDWLWQRSMDGETWETAWHIRYERAE